MLSVLIQNSGERGTVSHCISFCCNEYGHKNSTGCTRTRSLGGSLALSGAPDIILQLLLTCRPSFLRRTGHPTNSYHCDNARIGGRRVPLGALCCHPTHGAWPRLTLSIVAAHDAG
jgi:hypothetical protein